MAAVISTVVLFLVTWLLLWAVLAAAFLALLADVDYFQARWHQYTRIRQNRRAAAAELERINRRTTASIQRIGLAFMAAQHLVREQSAQDRGPSGRPT
jgi:hypothetical protein